MNIVSADEALPLTPHAYYVLLALARAPMSAYDVYDQCLDDSQEAISFNRRNLYRTVHNLEKWKFLSIEGEYAAAGSPYNKKVYQITKSGCRILQEEARRYQAASRLALQRLHQG